MRNLDLELPDEITMKLPQGTISSNRTLIFLELAKADTQDPGARKWLDRAISEYNKLMDALYTK